jgi:predicted enzyme related to lactoylglutathione lyase
MLRNSPFYASFAVDDISKAKEFYGERLGVEVIDVGGPKQAWFRDPAGNILSVIEG